MTRTAIVPALIVMLLCLTSALSAAESAIAPGDTLSITVMGEQDLTKRAVVDAQGNVVMPMAGEIRVSGMTTAEAAKSIASKLGGFIKNPQVTVELAEAAKVQVSITGEVKTPGIYPLSTGARLLDAITAAGGYTPTADMSRVTVTHTGAQSGSVIDLARYLLSGEGTANVTLASGDTIVIPAKETVALGVVSVLGAVRQSGQYNITKGMTVRDAVMLAGGPTELADTSRIEVKSQGAADVTIDLEKASSGDPTSNVAMKPGDVIFVGSKVQLGSFTINGGVTNPGKYEIKEKTTVTDAIAIAGGLRDLAKLDDVRILRASSDGTKSFRVNAKEIMDGKSDNVLIQRDDNIYVAMGKKRPDYLQVLSVAVSLGWLLTQ